MGKSTRGEQSTASEETVAGQNGRVKTATLNVAAEVIVGGGPHSGNHLEEGLVGLAEVAGNTPEEIAAAVDALRPKFK